MGEALSTAGTIHLYKHGITRTYLNLDRHGGAYAFDPANGTYTPVPLRTAIGALLIDLATLGFAPTQPYDVRFIAERSRRLVNLGYTTIS